MSSLRIAASLLITVFACVISGQAGCAEEPGPPETWLARLYARRATLRAEFTPFGTKQLEFFRPRSERDGKALLADLRGEAGKLGELLSRHLEVQRADRPPVGLEAVARAHEEAIEAASAQLARAISEKEPEIMERWAVSTLAGDDPPALLRALAEVTFGAGSRPSGVAREDLEHAHALLSDLEKRDHLHMALACLRMRVMDAAPDVGVQLLLIMSKEEMAGAQEDEKALACLARIELSPLAAELAGALSDLVQLKLISVWKTSLALEARREDWFGGSTSMSNSARSREHELAVLVTDLLGRKLEVWELDLFAARDRFAVRPDGPECVSLELRSDGAKVELRRGEGEWAAFEEGIAGLKSSLEEMKGRGSQGRRGWIQVGRGVSIGHVFHTIRTCFAADLHDIGWGSAPK
jgi:hypothetical protein